MNTFECLECGEAIKTADNQTRVHCPRCNTYFQVNYDAEFVNGIWRNLSSLIKLNTQ
jgi:phage FluMu protein Com